MVNNLNDGMVWDFIPVFPPRVASRSTASAW